MASELDGLLVLSEASGKQRVIFFLLNSINEILQFSGRYVNRNIDEFNKPIASQVWTDLASVQ